MKNNKLKHKGTELSRFLPSGKVAAIFALLLAITSAFAQNPVIRVYEDWSTQEGTQNDYQHTVTRSKAISGTTYYYTAGATLNSNGKYDMLVEKLTSSGAVLWTRTYNGLGNGDDVATDVQIDNVGNVYICGSYYKNASDSNNAIIIKYNAAGTQQWTYLYNGPGSRHDGFAALYLATSNSILAVGSAWGGTTNKYDFLQARVDSSGNGVWATTWNHSANLNDGAHNLYVRSGSLFIAGGAQSAATTYNYAVIKVSAANGSVTSTTISGGTGFGIDRLTDIQTDATGNVYVTGGVFNGFATLYDFKTIKLDTSLATVWTAQFNGADSLDDVATGLYVDPGGNVIVTGYENTAAQGKNYVTIKYNNTGAHQWTEIFDGGSGNDSATAIVVRDTNKIYVTGYSYNGSTKDYYTVKYDAAGNMKWGIGFNNIYNTDDRAFAIAIDTVGNVIVAGQNKINDSTYAYTTVRYVEKNTMLPQDTISETSTSFVYIDNRGQLLGTDTAAHPEIRYYTIHGNPNVYFSDTAVSYVFVKLDTSAANNDTLTRVDMKFVNANTGLRIRAVDTREDHRNFFLAHIPEGRTRVQDHSKLISFNVWNGVDMVYGSNGRGMKYYFICKPVGGGTSAGSIQLHYEGADSVHIGTSGELMIYTPQGVITQPKAQVWQINSSGNFSGLNWQPDYNKIGTRDIRFNNFGTYTSTDPIVIAIDWGPPPTPLHINNPEWSMYFGGSGDDEGTAVTTDDDGMAYFSGYTSSTDFPTEPGVGAVLANMGGFDAFIAQFGSADGTFQGTVMMADQHIWTTYYGGTADEKVYGVVSVGDHMMGSTYITGYTESSDFPTFNTAGIYTQTALRGTRDAFIVRVDNFTGGFQPTANPDMWATYFGGNGDEVGNAITADGSGNIFIAGNTSTSAYSTTSCGVPTDNGLPTCNNSNTFNNGSAYGGGASDGMIAQFDNTGTLQWSTFYGGPNADEINDVSTDGSDFYVTGKTQGGTGFPLAVSTGAYNQTTFGGGTYDAFLGKFKNGGHVWCTYYGGNGDDAAFAVEMDASGNVFMAGETGSSTPACTTTCLCTVPATGEFPMCKPTGSYFQGTGSLGVHGGGTSDGFFAKFSASGVLGWSTYYGGNSEDRVNDLAFDYLDQLYFSGSTTSTSPSANFDQTGPQMWYYQQSNNSGQSDGSIGNFDASYARQWGAFYGNYIYSTYEEVGNSIALRSTGPNDIYWYMTGSTNTPYNTVGGYSFYLMAFNNMMWCCPNAYTQYYNAGGYDAILTRFSANTMYMVSVEDMGEENPMDALVYPNPAAEGVTVKMDLPQRTDVTISVYSVSGQLLYNQKYGEQSGQFLAQVDFSTFATGMYILQVNTDNSCVNKKIIKR